MPAIVALPRLVEELLLQFGVIFPNAPARVHFAEYITGLLVAEHKTVSAIAREILGKTLAWVVEQAQHSRSLPDIQHRLALD